jgi:hypothetical protein
MRNRNLKLLKPHAVNVLQSKVSEDHDKNVKTLENVSQQKVNNNLDYYYINLGKVKIQ